MNKIKAKVAGASLSLWAKDLKDKPKGIIKTSAQVFKIINEYAPSIGTNIRWRDSKFEIVEWSWWKKVIESQFWTTEQIKYISEVSDCEAFSLFFLSICELYLKTNGVFSVGGTCKWDTLKGTETSQHRYNLVVATEDGEIGIWLVEPMYNKFTKLIKGSDWVTVYNVFGINTMLYKTTNIAD